MYRHLVVVACFAKVRHVASMGEGQSFGVFGRISDRGSTLTVKPQGFHPFLVAAELRRRVNGLPFAPTNTAVTEVLLTKLLNDCPAGMNALLGLGCGLEVSALAHVPVRIHGEHLVQPIKLMLQAAFVVTCKNQENVVDGIYPVTRGTQ